MGKPKQIDSLEILNEDDRIFKSWGTVEVRDKEGQLIPISEFKSVMPVIMKRGGIITDRHTNRVIAKILNYEFKQKETNEGLKDGIMITGNVFKDYQIDDMIWEGIKKNIYKGLSFGGRNHQLDMKYEKGMPTEVLKQLEGFEFALVPGMGNQEATMEEVNYLAKCDKEISKLGEDGAHEHKVDQFGNHGHPIIEKRLDILEGKNDNTDDKTVKKELTKNGLSLLNSSNKPEKYIKKSDLNISMEEKKPEEVKKEEVVETPSTPAPTNPMEEIKNMLSQILQAIQTPAPAPMVAKEDEEKDKDKKEEDVDKQEKVTLPKTPEEETGEGKPAEGEVDDKVKFVEKMDEMKKEIVSEIKKGLFKESANTPRPATEIKKELNTKPKSWADVQKMVEKRI